MASESLAKCLCPACGGSSPRPALTSPSASGFDRPSAAELRELQADIEHCRRAMADTRLVIIKIGLARRLPESLGFVQRQLQHAIVRIDLAQLELLALTREQCGHHPAHQRPEGP